MPYSGADDKKLPAHVKKLSDKKRSQWVHVVNSALEEGKDEGTAFAMANGVVKNKGEKGYIMSLYDIDSRQVSQEQAEYNPVGMDGKQACANCNWFIPSDDACVLVSGDIVPTGKSKFWTAVTEYEPKPMEVVIVDAKEQEKALPAPSHHAIENTPAVYPPTNGGPGVQEKKVIPKVIKPDDEKKPTDTEDDNDDSESEEDESSKKKAEPADKVDTKKKSFVGGVTATLKSLLGYASTPPVQPAHDLKPFVIYKDASGVARWLAVVSNNFKDKDGEIFTAAAHKEYVDFCDNNNWYPELRAWHIDGGSVVVGQAQMVDFDGNFLVAAGVLNKEFTYLVDTLKGVELGVSHGFYCLQDKEGVIHQYRSFEVSFLPIEAAANSWTQFSFIDVKENDEMALAPHKKTWLQEVAGMSAEHVAALEQNNEKSAANLKALGIDYKESEAGDVATLTEQVAQLTTVVVNMNEQIKQLNGKTVALTKSIDQRVAEIMTPSVSATTKGHKASESDETVVDDTEKNDLIKNSKTKEEKDWWDQNVFGSIQLPTEEGVR